MKKNLAVLGITLTLTTITCSPIYAKKIYPAEIMEAQKEARLKREG